LSSRDLKCNLLFPLLWLTLRLGNVFNNLEKDSIGRFFTYLELVRFAGRSKLLDSLSSQFSQIPQWVAEWRCDVSQVRELYKLLSSVLLAEGKT
jgi:hypothetical protein